MNKFRKLGFIEYHGGVKAHKSLPTVVLRESAPTFALIGSTSRELFESRISAAYL
jgi:hypothetical protein